MAGFSKLKHPGLLSKFVLSKFGFQVNDKSIFSMSHAAFVTYLHLKVSYSSEILK